ncbi:hypothetical protein QZH41_013411, partial [Actinostola sp. cb2023]
MNIEGYDVKIIGGKIRKIPIYRKDGPSATQTNCKIGSKYSIIPPISGLFDQSQVHHKPDKLSFDILAQRVSEALVNVSKAKLDNVRLTFQRLDTDKSGLITTKELNDVFLMYNIFILGSTLMQSLIKRFERNGGGVYHEKLWNFLAECYTARHPDKTKLNGHVAQPRLINRRDATMDEIRAIEIELERQLASTRQPNLKELKRACKNRANVQDGSILFSEVGWFFACFLLACFFAWLMRELCLHHELCLSRSLLERLLNHFDSNRDGSINWSNFLELIEKSMSKDVGSGHAAITIDSKHQYKQPVKKHKSSVQTQTKNGNDISYVISLWQEPISPDPVYVRVSGRKVYVYPPDEHIDTTVSSEPPDAKLVLEWVYGYRGRDCRKNLSVLQSGELVYFIAAVVVIFDKKANKQRHYTEHTDDIKSMTVHPDGVTMATGQVAGHNKVQGEPHVRIWSSESLQTKMVIGLGYFERAVISLAFSFQPGIDKGRYLVNVDDNDYHTITVWDWDKNKKIANARGHMDQVLVAEFSPFNNRQIVSCGKHHVSFWTLNDDNKLKCDRGRFDHNVKPKYITCFTFSKDGDVITGDTNGTIFVWPEDDNQISNSVKNAHDGSVYSLLVLSSGVLLSAGGRDGVVRAWDRRLQPMGVQLKFPANVTGIRTLVVDALNNLYVGTVNNSIWCTDLAVGKSPLLDVGIRLRPILEGHTDELRGLATHPTSPKFITAGGDKTLKLWNADEKSVVWSARLPAAAQAADFSPKEDVVAIGHKDGSFTIIQSSSGNVLVHKKCSREKISELKFSPDGVYLALASHDNYIYVFKLQLNGVGQSIELQGKCSGHTSYVTHLDWSADSTQIQSTSGDYELLFWDVLICERITSSEEMRNTDWASHNCVLGYPVLGIWPDESDGTDINAVDRSHSKRLLATADDFGNVNMFRYPCANLKTCKSVLSPHVAEFVPQSAVTKKITQDDNKIQPEVPVPEEMPASTREDTFQKIRVGGGESQERQAKKKAPTKNKADKQVSKKVTIATGVLQIKLQDTPDPTTRITGAAQPSNTKTTLSKK